MKKRILLGSILCFGLVFLAACGAQPEEKKEAPAESKKPQVTVTTSFLNDMVHELAGDKVDVQMIIPAGEDPHVYQMKPEDSKKISDADLVLYHGLHFEGKMNEALEKKGKAVSAHFPKDKLGTMEEDGKEEIDPHFWFDISLYKMAVEEAAKQLIEVSKDNKETIEKNKEDYLKRLTKVDEESRAAIASIPKENRYLVTPHDAFNYFSRAYDIEVVAPQGVSTESEVSNQDIEKTIDFIVEHKIKAVFAETTTDPARLEKLKEGAKAKGFDVKIVKGEGQELFSDSLAPKGSTGDTFITMLEHNVRLITENLK